jgi:hypothetical protein
VQSLNAALVPLGTGSRPDGVEDYWFRIGDRVFAAGRSLHPPPCHHLLLSDTERACRCRTPVGQVASCPSTGAPAEGTVTGAAPHHEPRVSAVPASGPVASHSPWFWRVEVGGGVLNTVLEDDSASAGAALSSIVGGLALGPRFLLGGSLSTATAFERHRVTRILCSTEMAFVCTEFRGYVNDTVSAIGLYGGGYPFSSSGLRLDFGAGVAATREHFGTTMHYLAAPQFFAGPGYEHDGGGLLFGLTGRFMVFGTGKFSGTSASVMLSVGKR